MSDAPKTHIPKLTLRSNSSARDTSEVRENLSNIRLMAERNIERTRTLYSHRNGPDSARPVFTRDGSSGISSSISQGASRFRSRPLYTFTGGGNGANSGAVPSTPRAQGADMYSPIGRRSPSLIQSNHLLHCQIELEKVMREKHDLERRCMEMETENLSLNETLEDLITRFGVNNNNNINSPSYQFDKQHVSPGELPRTPRATSEKDTIHPNPQFGTYTIPGLEHSMKQAVAAIQSSQQANERMHLILSNRETEENTNRGNDNNEYSPQPKASQSPRHRENTMRQYNVTTVNNEATAIELIDFFIDLQKNISRFVAITEEACQERDQLQKEQYDNGQKLSFLIQQYECDKKATDDRVYTLERELQNCQDQAAAALKEMEEVLRDTQRKLLDEEHITANVREELLSYVKEMHEVRDEHRTIVEHLNRELDHVVNDNDDLKLLNSNLGIEIEELRIKSRSGSDEYNIARDKELVALSDDIEQLTEERDTLQMELNEALAALQVYEIAEMERKENTTVTAPAAGCVDVDVSDFTEASDRMDKLLKVILSNQEEIQKKHREFEIRQQESNHNNSNDNEEPKDNNLSLSEDTLSSSHTQQLLHTSIEKIQSSIKSFECCSDDLQYRLVSAYEEWAATLSDRVTSNDVNVMYKPEGIPSGDVAAEESGVSATNTTAMELQLTKAKVLELEEAIKEANEELIEAKKQISFLSEEMKIKDEELRIYIEENNALINEKETIHDCDPAVKRDNNNNNNSNDDNNNNAHEVSLLHDKVKTLEHLLDTTRSELQAANKIITEQSQELSDEHETRSGGLGQMESALMRLTTDYGKLMDSYITVVALLKDIGILLDPFNCRKEEDVCDVIAIDNEDNVSNSGQECRKNMIIIPNPSARSVLTNCYISSTENVNNVTNEINKEVLSSLTPTTVQCVVVQLIPSYSTFQLVNGPSYGCSVDEDGLMNTAVVPPTTMSIDISNKDGEMRVSSMKPMTKWPGESYVPILPSFLNETTMANVSKSHYNNTNDYKVPDDVLLDEWREFDALTLDDKDHCNGNLLVQTAVKLFDNLNIPDSLVDRDTWLRFAETLQRGYRRENPYHNSTHAADVAQGFIFLLRNAVMTQDDSSKECSFNMLDISDKEVSFWDVLTPLERFSCLFAGLAHDHQHPGKNNQFLVKHRDPVAVRYNNESVLETHHVSSVFHILQDPSCDVTTLMTDEDTVKFHQLVSKMIVATDMSKHIEYLSIFATKTAPVPTRSQSVASGYTSPTSDSPTPKSNRRGSRIRIPAIRIALSRLESDFSNFGENSFRGQTDFIKFHHTPARQVELQTTSLNEQIDEVDRIFALQMLLHLADISNPMRDYKIAEKWSNAINEEFFLQGDTERRLGYAVPLECDRSIENPNPVGFVDFIVLPLMRLVVRRYPSLSPLLDLLLSNRAKICEEKYPVRSQSSGNLKHAPSLPPDPSDEISININNNNNNNDKLKDSAFFKWTNEDSNRVKDVGKKKIRENRMFSEIPVFNDTYNEEQLLEESDCENDNNNNNNNKNNDKNDDRDTRELEKLIINTQNEVSTLLKDKEMLLGQLEDATNVIKVLNEKIYK